MKLIDERDSFVSILSTLKQDWPAGQLEISTFQQKLVVYLDQKDQNNMDEVVIHIMEVCDLFNQLSREGLIRAWSDLPDKDNTVVIGEKPEDAIPQFLPDLAVATELLKWAGQKIQIKEELTSLSQRNFRNPVVYHALKNRRLLVSGLSGLFILLITGGIYFNQAMESRINDLETQLSKNQERNQKSLDSLNIEFRTLYNLNYQMAADTQQQAALKVVGDAVDRSFNQLDRRTSNLERRLEENQTILKSSDSLLRKLSN